MGGSFSKSSSSKRARSQTPTERVEATATNLPVDPDGKSGDEEWKNDPLYGPCAVGIMSGPNAPDMCALVWCGWRVRTHDKKGTPFDEPADLMDPEVRKTAEEDIAVADALVAAICCKSFTKAREIPVRKGRVKPLPLRGPGKAHWGLPRLREKGAEKDRRVVEISNSLSDWIIERCHEVADDNRAITSENPAGSYLWDFTRQKELAAKGVKAKYYDACCFEGTRHKRQRLDTNVDTILNEDVRCRHVHSSKEWDPVPQGKGRVHFVTADEEEYTAAYSFYMAVKLSLWAVLRGRGVLRVQRPILDKAEHSLRAVCTGDRVRWLSLAPDAARAWAMPGLGLRLQLSWPREIEPYGELPALAALATIPVAAHKDLPAGHVYVGYGSPQWRLERSVMAPRHWPNRAQDVPYALRQYASELMEPTAARRKWLTETCRRTPPVTTVVVDEAPGQATHGEIVATAIWKHRREALQQVKRPQLAGRATMLAMLPTIASASVLTFRPGREDQSWRDEDIQACFRKVFPYEWLAKVPFPPLEDVVNCDMMRA